MAHEVNMISSDKYFKQLFFEKYQKLFNTAFRILRNEQASEDVTQDVFTKLWINRERINIEGSIDAYLKRAIINTSLNYLEKHKRDVPLDLHSHEKEETKTLQSILDADLTEHINKAVSTLPSKCRVIFCLSRFDGLSNQEIADQLNLSKRTVENQLGNALIKLRQQLKPIISATMAIASMFL